MRSLIPIVVQEWEESESGWGCRPDGFSLHLTVADAEAYVKKHWDDEKKYNTKGTTPHEYTRECGKPQLLDVEECVYEALQKAKKNNKNGIRVWCRDLKNIASEFRKHLPEEIALKKAIELDKKDKFLLHVWEASNSPKEFQGFADFDKYKWVAYVPSTLISKLSPPKSGVDFPLDNGGKIVYVINNFDW